MNLAFTLLEEVPRLKIKKIYANVKSIDNSSCKTNNSQ